MLASGFVCLKRENKMRGRKRHWLAALLVNFSMVLTSGAETRAQDKPAETKPQFRQVIPFAAMLYYEEARALLKAGKPDEALVRLQRAAQEFPDFFQAHLDLAQEHFRRKDMPTAAGSLEKARLINDRDPRVYRLFGLMMMEQGKFKMAEYAFRQSLERDADFAQTYQAHGAVLVELALSETAAPARANWLTQAEQQLLKSLAMSAGKLAFSHLHLSRVYEMRGENLKAAQELESFLLKNPGAANEKAIREAVAKLRK